MMDKRQIREERVRATMRGARLPLDVLEVASGDPDEVSEFVARISALAAGCIVDGKMVNSTELAMIAYQYGWTRRQTEVAAQVLRMNDVWKEIGA